MKDEVLKILREHGYKTQRAAVRALREQVPHYASMASEQSVAVHLNNILTGIKPLPAQMADGLLQITDSDERLQKLIENETIARTARGNPRHLNSVFQNYQDRLRAYFLRLDEPDKLDLLRDYVDLVAKHTGLEDKID